MGIDFTKISKPKYKAWRILHTSPSWQSAYLDRHAVIGDYASAIIFPEQLFCFEEIYFVTASVSVGSLCSIGITVSKSSYVIYGNDIFEKQHEWSRIRELEEAYSPPALRIKYQNQSINFFESLIMGKKADAVKYGMRALTKFG